MKIKEKIKQLKATINSLSKEIVELEKLEYIEEYINKPVRVIDGGYGCTIANGCIGKIIDKPEDKPLKYSGQFWGSNAELYILGIDGVTYGLCNGFKIDLATDKELVEQFLNL